MDAFNVAWPKFITKFEEVLRASNNFESVANLSGTQVIAGILVAKPYWSLLQDGNDDALKTFLDDGLAPGAFDMLTDQQREHLWRFVRFFLKCASEIEGC